MVVVPPLGPTQRGGGTRGRRRWPYDYDEIIDALEGEEDDAADSGGEDYELAG